MIIQRVLRAAGLELGPVHVQNGKGNLDRNLSGYNYAAKLSHWLVLRDLNGDAPCAPTLVSQLLPRPAELMSLRIAVRAAEAWLMADRESFARFLGISVDILTRDPEQLLDPKGEVMRLAKRSRRREIKDSMPVPEGMSGRVGPGYTAKIVEFASAHWRPEEAARLSPSLARCMAALNAWQTTP